MSNTRPDFTFKHNLTQGRHGWLRLTPAYSVKLVQSILKEAGSTAYVLDPFSGTGTTGLVCGEQNVRCDLMDINPFLVWFATAKTAQYTVETVLETRQVLNVILNDLLHRPLQEQAWTPPIHHIVRWWSSPRLIILANLYQAINHYCPTPTLVKNLLLIAFCRTMIDWSNAAFNHQSLSFKPYKETLFAASELDTIVDYFGVHVQTLFKAALTPVTGQICVVNADARYITSPVDNLYTCVITSPPYPNRMSYIRELRPYMYWLGYLSEAREAGELDWQAIGGTWGIATSRLSMWQPGAASTALDSFKPMLQQIAAHSHLLANYVNRYFEDIFVHLTALYQAMANGATLYYVVGNSTFYQILVPVEQIYAYILRQVGFQAIDIKTLRKRNSKKELFEFIITARK